MLDYAKTYARGRNLVEILKKIKNGGKSIVLASYVSLLEFPISFFYYI